MVNAMMKKQDDFVSDVSQRMSGVSQNRSKSARSPSYECDSPEYLALKARVEDFNSESQDGNSQESMALPSCTGGNRSLPDCDSDEYQEIVRKAKRTGSPHRPLRRGRKTSSAGGA